MSIDELEGAESRDKFKKYHKKADSTTGSQRRLACDIDLALATKIPEPGIAGIFDYKEPNDTSITDAEAFVYNSLMDHYPVFLIHGEKSVVDTPIEEQVFRIERLDNIHITKTGSNWYEVESVEKSVVNENLPWGGSVQDITFFNENGVDGLIEWEDRLRYNDL